MTFARAGCGLFCVEDNFVTVELLRFKGSVPASFPGGMSIPAQSALACAAATICAPDGATSWLLASSTPTTPTSNGGPALSITSALPIHSPSATSKQIDVICTALYRLLAPCSARFTSTTTTTTRLSTLDHGTVAIALRGCRCTDTLCKCGNQIYKPSGRHDAHGRHRHRSQVGRGRRWPQDRRPAVL
jgi:hypothetical protein